MAISEIKDHKGLWEIILGHRDRHYETELVIVDTISERPLVVVIVDSRSGVERRSPPLVIRRGRDRVSQFARKATPPRISVKDGVVNFQVSGTHNCR